MDEFHNDTDAAANVAADAYQSPGRKGGYTRDGQPLAPSVQQSAAAKLESTNMTAEFGKNGVTDSVHSGLSANADPSQYTTDPDGEVRRLGQTLEQQERAEGLNAELDAIHDDNVRWNDTPEGGSVWEPIADPDREADSRDELAQIDTDPDPRPHEVTDPQTLISREQLGEVNRYAAKLAERFDVPTFELSRRMSWKLAPMLGMPDNGAPVGYRGTDDDDHPIYILTDPYQPRKYDALNAAQELRSELLYELPEHTEGIKASHKSADAVGVVTKLFDPKGHNQVQVGRAEDADGREFGFCIFRDSIDHRWFANDWKTPNTIQMVGVGDTIEISNAKPKAYRNIISLTVTSKSTVRVTERGDGPVIINNPQASAKQTPHDPNYDLCNRPHGSAF